MTHAHIHHPRRSGKTAIRLMACQEQHLTALADHIAAASGQHPDHVATMLRRVVETLPATRYLNHQPPITKDINLQPPDNTEHRNRYGAPLHTTPDCARRRRRAWYG